MNNNTIERASGGGSNNNNTEKVERREEEKNAYKTKTKNVLFGIYFWIIFVSICMSGQMIFISLVRDERAFLDFGFCVFYILIYPSIHRAKHMASSSCTKYFFLIGHSKLAATVAVAGKVIVTIVD